MLFFCSLFVSIDEKCSFFGTYALDISSLTSSIKYISESTLTSSGGVSVFLYTVKLEGI